MSWVKQALAELLNGRQVKIRPIGGSMRGRIESGQRVTLIPIGHQEVGIDDIVFIKWKNNYLLHIVKDKTESALLIGNNLGKINGWTPRNTVIGKVIAIEE